MEKSIGTTIGLECFIDDKRITLVKVDYTTAPDDSVRLTAVSGRNMSRVGRYSKIVEREVFDDRPTDPYDKAREAIWALGVLGLTPAALDMLDE